MTKQDAKKIKGWRKGGSSWRAVASRAADCWPDRCYTDGNQLEGQDLCTKAALLLGENPHRYPWN